MSVCTVSTARTTLLGIALLVCLTPALVAAQDSRGDDASWTLLTRVVLSGSSDESDPPGLTVLSGVTVEAALRHSLSRRLSAEVNVRTESREVDRDAGADETEPLGSLETLPLALTLQYRPSVSGRVHPYIGAGVALTVVWERSGFLDPYPVESCFGPAVQVGADLELGPGRVLNLDIRWNSYTADIQDVASVKVDPLALGLGFGVRF